MNDTITLSQFMSQLPKFLTLARIAATNTMYLSTSTTKPTGLGIVLEKAVKKNPNGNAILYEDTRITYREFNEWSNRIANYFLGKGVKKGDVVAVFI